MYISLFYQNPNGRVSRFLRILLLVYTIWYRWDSMRFINYLFRLSLDILQALIISICLSCSVQINDFVVSKLITLEFVQFDVNSRTLHSCLPDNVRFT